MSESSISAFWNNFLGDSPAWYKQTIIGFIVLNPILLTVAGPVVTGRLSIRYRHPTPLDVDLRFEARVVRHSGRRLVARARCLAPRVDGGQEVTAEAEALFVSIPRRSQEVAGGTTEDDG